MLPICEYSVSAFRLRRACFLLVEAKCYQLSQIWYCRLALHGADGADRRWARRSGGLELWPGSGGFGSFFEQTSPRNWSVNLRRNCIRCCKIPGWPLHQCCQNPRQLGIGAYSSKRVWPGFLWCAPLAMLTNNKKYLNNTSNYQEVL